MTDDMKFQDIVLNDPLDAEENIKCLVQFVQNAATLYKASREVQSTRTKGREWKITEAKVDADKEINAPLFLNALLYYIFGPNHIKDSKMKQHLKIYVSVIVQSKFVDRLVRHAIYSDKEKLAKTNTEVVDAYNKLLTTIPFECFSSNFDTICVDSFIDEWRKQFKNQKGTRRYNAHTYTYAVRGLYVKYLIDLVVSILAPGEKMNKADKDEPKTTQQLLDELPAAIDKWRENKKKSGEKTDVKEVEIDSKPDISATTAAEDLPSAQPVTLHMGQMSMDEYLNFVTTTLKGLSRQELEIFRDGVDKLIAKYIQIEIDQYNIKLQNLEKMKAEAEAKKAELLQKLPTIK